MEALVGARYDVFGQETRYDRKLATLSRTDKVQPHARYNVAAQRYRVVPCRTASRSSPRPRRFALAANITAPGPKSPRTKIGVKLDLLGGKLNVTGALFNLERTNIKNTDPANPSRQINVGTQRTSGFG